MTDNKRRDIIDQLLKNSMLLFKGSPETGYSISVTSAPEGTKVKAKLGKKTDATAVKRQLQQQYPNAEIEIEGGKASPLIREISTKPIKHREENDTKNNP